MKRALIRWFVVTVIFFPVILLFVRPMAKAQNDTLKSRAELSGYEETTRYEEVMRFIDELQRRSANIRVESFGQSEEGRQLPLMILSQPAITQPRQAKASGKPVVFVMANIHAGEVEGKEAMLHFARRVLLGDLKPLLRQIVILIAPIYNADGNELISLNNRTAQNGPIAGVGTRENAKGLDLNRDYMKLESAEANALIRLFNRWDPHLTVDLHTTNGSYHGYHLTYSPTLNPNADARLIAFERARMLPAISRAMLHTHKFRTYFYGNFATQAALGRELNHFGAEKPGEKKVWRTFDHRPRFGNNYVGLRNRLTILSEAYSYLDFRGRIEVSEAFVEEICKYTASHAAEVLSLIDRVDADSLRAKTATAGVDFELKTLPTAVPILVGEVKRQKNPRSGKEMSVMVEDRVKTVRMPDYGLFAASRSVPMPRAYIFRNDPRLRGVIEKLRAHGLPLEELTEGASLEVETFLIDKISKEPRAFQGHQGVRMTGTRKLESTNFPSGSLLVRTSHPLSALAFYLLEPESDDGLVYWNFFDAFLEKGASFPVYRVMDEVKAPSRVCVGSN
ncbi:MAG: M14 family metallopeptidase [Acidobacteriota bacterium]